MDAFYAAVEQLDDPSLRGKPILVGGRSGRGVVTTASYEARPFGVGSAMPMSEALRRCPKAIVVPPRFERYTEISKIIMSVFRDFSPVVEPLSLDEAFMDLTGAEGIFGGPRAMGNQIRAAVFKATTGLTVSVGVANSKFVAKVASDYRKPDGLTVVAPWRVREFLDPQPIRRLWGVGKKTEPRLKRLGLHSIRDVFDADPTWLSVELGSLGRHIYRLAHNDDPRPVRRGRRAKSVGAEYTLGKDVRGAEAIKPHLLHAADRIAPRLRKKGHLAGGVRVKLKTHRFELHTRQMVLDEPTDHADTLYQAALSLLPKFDLRPPMRLVGLAAYNILGEGDPIQGSLFDQPERVDDQELDRAIDTVREKFGKDLIKRAVDVDNTWRQRAPELDFEGEEQ